MHCHRLIRRAQVSNAFYRSESRVRVNHTALYSRLSSMEVPLTVYATRILKNNEPYAAPLLLWTARKMNKNESGNCGERVCLLHLFPVHTSRRVLHFSLGLLSIPPRLSKWQPKQIWANWRGNKALLKKILWRSEEQWWGGEGERRKEREVHIETQRKTEGIAEEFA